MECVMPAQVAPEHPVIRFQHELAELIDRYELVLEPADIALVLSTNLAPILSSYTDRRTYELFIAHVMVELPKRMAKASIES
jgi:hypothetical protein